MATSSRISMHRASRFLASFAFPFATIMTEVTAQTYPSHPISMIVPLAAGGTTDTVARILAEGMRAPLGQSLIIENVPGAGGSVGVAERHEVPLTAIRSLPATGRAMWAAELFTQSNTIC
jgi:tripartite-type tricarboxylate transporter receptor subunit TctC